MNCHDIGARIEPQGRLTRDDCLRLSNVLLVEQELPIEIGQVDGVEVNLSASVTPPAISPYDFNVLETRENEVLEQLAADA